MSFRRLLLSDRTDFLKLDHQAFPKARLNPDKYSEYVQEKGFFGYFKDRILVGYLLMRPVGRYCHLNRIAVRPDFQGQGIGNNLMEFVHEFFSSQSCKQVGLYVRQSNEKAISLYQNHGYNIDYSSWHYIIEEEKFYQNYSINSDPEVKIQTLQANDVPTILDTFPDLLPEVVQSYFESPDNNRYLGGFKNSVLVLFARFNPEFSGCMPFKFLNIQDIDIFIHMMFQNYIIEEKSSLRLTFDRHEELADQFLEAGYHLHHRLFKMSKSLV